MRDLLVLFSNKRFTTLWFARTISNFGNGMAPIAVSFGVLGLEGATAGDLGTVLAAHAIPVVLMLPLGGVLADRLPRAFVISVTDLILSVFIAAVGVLFITDRATVLNLALIHVVAGVLNALWWPAFPGLVPAVMQERDLQQANGLLAIGSNGGMVFGTAAGGVITAFIGPGWAILIDACTFLIAGALVWTFRDVAPAGGAGESMIRDLHDGWKTFLSFRWVWAIVAAFSVIVACMRAGFDVAGPVLMKAEYSGAASWAVIQTGQSIGYVLGAMLATRVRPARPLVYSLFFTLTMPVLLIMLALNSPLWLLAIGGVLIGMCWDQWGVYWTTALQTHIPRDSLSRVSSFDAMGSLVFGPVGLAVAGPAIAAFGVSDVMLGCAAITVLVLALPLLEREVRELRWVDPEPVTAANGD